MKFLKNILFLLLFAQSFSAFSEDKPTDIPSDTINLEEIEVTANKLVNFTTGSKIQRISSSEINSNNTTSLSELLSSLTTLSVKSYGLTGLSNISLRGMSSKHTAVVWNGFNLQSSMNGGTDMSSVPSFLIDEIDIQYGGASALFGSGAVGGIIHLNNALKIDNKIQLGYNQSYGSFNNFFEGLKFNYSKKRFASSTRIYHTSGENDFEFVNTQKFGKPTVKQTNSASKQYGILQSNLIKINNNQSLTTNVWFQDYYREIPAMMTNTIGAANEDSKLFRISAAWNRNGEISSWYTRFYYNNEYLIHTDSLIDLVSKMRNSSLIGEIENKLSLGNNFLINMGINNSYDIVNTSNYNTNKYRNKTALYASIKHFTGIKNFASILSLREEIADSEFTPFTFSLSTRYYINKFINLNTNISKNYNLPTFNDLYWNPGGNPDLKAEKGWSEDFGVSINHSNKNNLIDFNISVFNINLNNHVIWLPTESSYWTAQNVEKMWSRGIETNLKYSINFKHFKLSASTLYTYTKSTYEKSENIEESSIGKQLMYIPLHKSCFNLNGSYKWLYIRYNHNFTGERFITKDNSESVAPYQVANASIGGIFKLKTSEFNINFKVNNIWNETYEVMAFYAMPLRYYSISLSYNFNKLLIKK